MAKSPLFLDIETSGLRPEDGAVILSIGAIAEVTNKRTGVSYVEFEQVIHPTAAQWAAASQDALRVNGFTLDKLAAFGIPAAEAIVVFCEWLDEHKVSMSKYFVVGQNPKFDLGFLEHFFGGQLSFVGFPFADYVDNRDLYSVLVNRRVMPWLDKSKGGRTSENISVALGVKPEPWPHSAIEGARAVMRNYRAMVEKGAVA